MAFLFESRIGSSESGSIESSSILFEFSSVTNSSCCSYVGSCFLVREAYFGGSSDSSKVASESGREVSVINCNIILRKIHY